MSKKQKIIMGIISSVLFFWGGYIFFSIAGWKLVGAIWLVLTASNIERRL